MRAFFLTAAALSGVAAAAVTAAVAWSAPAGAPAGTASGPASAAHKPDTHQCFYHNDVNGFAAPDIHTVYVRVGVRDVYRMEVFGVCPDVDWTMRIGIQARGQSWICVGDQVELFVPNQGMGRQRCPMRVAAKLTPEEIKALPKGARP